MFFLHYSWKIEPVQYLYFGIYLGSFTKAWGFPGGSDGEQSACSAGDTDLIPGLGRFPGEGNSNVLQYSCLENPMDGGAWQTTVHGVAKSQTQPSEFTFTFFEA